jgi:hypothetical protein
MRRFRLKSKDLFENNELYDSFQKVMADRAVLITKLKKELATTKNNQFMS